MTDKEKITEWLNDSIAANNRIRELFSSGIPEEFYKFEKPWLCQAKMNNLSQPFLPVGQLKEVMIRDPHYGDSATYLVDEGGNMVIKSFQLNHE